MADQGYKATLDVSLDGATSWEKVGGATSTGIDMSAADLDITEFGDDAINRLSGLFDSGVPLSGNYRHGDAGSVLVRDAFLNRTPLFFRFLVDGTNGFKVETRVFSWKLNSAPNEVTKFDATVSGIAKPTIV